MVVAINYINVGSKIGAAKSMIRVEPQIIVSKRVFEGSEEWQARRL